MIGRRAGLAGAVGEESIDLAVQLEVVLPGIEREQADELAKAAYDMCPYSRATAGNVDAKVTVSDA